MNRRFASGINPALIARHAPAQPPRGPHKAQRAQAPALRPGDAAEAALSAALTLLCIPHEVQYPWGRELTPPRRFRSDAYVASARLLVEIDGGVHRIRDKHTRDLARQNLAVGAGFAVLRFTPEQATDGTAALEVAAYLASRPSDSDTPEAP